MDATLARILGEPIPPVVLVLGAERWLVDGAVAALRERVLPDVGPPAFNLSEARASGPDAVEAIGMARTLPMMAGRRLVMVRDLDEGSDAFFGELEAYLGAVSDTTVLLLSGAGFPKVEKGGSNWAARIPKRVEAVGRVLKYVEGAVDPARFAVDHARSLGHALGLDEARLLVDLVGRELGRVAREVEKAALYVEEGAPIDAAAIGSACSALAEAEVWSLTGGIAAANPGMALGALHRLLEQGDEPHHLLALVGWQLRAVLRVGELVRRRAPDAEIVAAAGRMRSDVLRKVRAALEQRNPGAADTLERLARANRAMNQARAGGDRTLEALVLDLTLGR